MVAPELIVHHIEGTPQRRATLKQLLRELKVRGTERTDLKAALAALVRQGRLRERRHCFELTAATVPNAAAPPRATSTPGEVVGTISLHRDGYGFVTPEPPLAAGGDIFIPPPFVAGAMPGDVVAVRIEASRAGPGRDGGRRDGRLQGRVVAIRRRAHTLVVGTFRRDPRGDYVQPIDDRIRGRVLIASGDDRPPARADAHRVLGEEARPQPNVDGVLDGQVVEIEITRFAGEATPARGKVLEVLGRRDDFGVDVEIIIRKHHLPHRFPPPVLAEAAALSPVIPEAELERRLDFRNLPIVTIDGESARDFDDAVHVRRLDNGHYELQVHIADVSHYVRPGSALDAEARLRGTSVYFPDRAVPMLPQELSTWICSLLPREPRLVMSCLMEIAADGKMVRHSLAAGVIRSAERMTYTQVNAILDGDAAARERFAPLVEHFELMAELQRVLYAERMRRGSIDFDLPEPEIAFDEFGLMRSIVKSERNIAHRIIEEFMLAAAQTVAAHVEAAGLALVYRIHEPPDLKKVAEFEEIAGTFGYSLGAGPLPILKKRVHGRIVEVPLPVKFKISPRHYQKLTGQIAGKPEERMLSYLMLRSLQQARYSARNAGHFALATACYTHFTSPIRRYPDLLVHRIVKALLAGGPPETELASAESLEPLARQASVAERRADEAERELLDWKIVRFMEQRLGEQFPALILRVTRDGFWVELEDQFIEGLVPASSLTDDDYRFRSTTQEWVGEHSRRRFKLGQKLEVVADRIDPVRQQIHFAPVVPRKPSKKRR